jgi:hypothetical protein
MKLTAAVKEHRFINITIVLVIAGIIAAGAFSWTGKAKRPQVSAIAATSKIPGVDVLGVENTSLGSSQILVVRLQNNSGKAIKALTIRTGKTWVTKNYLLIEESFATGTVLNQTIPPFSESQVDGREITLAAVLFADGTAEGDSHYAQMLLDQRAGMRDQARRIIKTLRALSGSSESDQEKSMESCEAEILRMPLKRDGASADYEEGLLNSQKWLLNHISEIKAQRRSNHLAEAQAKQEKLTRVFESLIN